VNRLRLAVVLLAGVVMMGAVLAVVGWIAIGSFREARATPDEKLSAVWANSALQIAGAEFAFPVEESAISKEDAIAAAKRDFVDRGFGIEVIEPTEAVWVQRVGGDTSYPSHVWMVTFEGICVGIGPVPRGINPDDIPCMDTGIVWVDGKTGETVGATFTSYDPAAELPTPTEKDREAYYRSLGTVIPTEVAKPVPATPSPTATMAAEEPSPTPDSAKDQTE